MSEEWQRPIARFRRKDGVVVGAGVLAFGGIVLTCAHVIEDALRDSGVALGPGVTVQVEFPFATAGVIEAKVAEQGWHPAIDEAQCRVDGRLGDLAVLTPLRPEEVADLDACILTETDPRPGTEFSALGFPVGYPDGALTQGILRDVDAGGRQDAKATDEIGHFADPGFSGAPIFARQGMTVTGKACLGLCVTNDADGLRIARIIPAGQLARALRAVISPYRWLAAFEARDTSFYFGRDSLATELWEELRRDRFLLMAGDPGSGKSSLLRAGLGPRARAEGRTVLIMRPLDAPRAEFCRVLGLPADPDPGDDTILDTVEAKLPLLLGFDQAEEVLRGGDPTAAAAFFRLLGDLRERGGEHLLIVLAARSDALPALLKAQPRSRLLERHLRHIGEMSREELRSAIAQPAERLRVGFQRGLVDRIVNDVLARKTSLPMLQLCLSKLWVERDDAVITSGAYEGMRGVTGALAQHADGLVEDIGMTLDGIGSALKLLVAGMAERIGIPLEGTWIAASLARNSTASAVTRAADRPVAKQVAGIFFKDALVSLVELGSTAAEDRRRRIRLDTLSMPGAAKLLSERHLVVEGDGVDGTTTVELAHDSLLTEWPLLRDWLEEDRTFRRWYERLLYRATETPDDLLGEAALAEAEARIERPNVWLDPRVTAFIERSHEIHKRRTEDEAARLRAERDAALRMGSLFLVERARKATAEGDAMTGMLLALEALPDVTERRERPVVAAAEFALYEAWMRNSEMLCFPSSSAVHHAAFSPDGARLITASVDGTARVWDAGTGERIALCEGHGDSVLHSAFSPDGTRLVTASEDETARVWDAETGKQLAACEGHGGSVWHAAFSLDGTRVVTASVDGTARVWDAETGKQLAVCKGHRDRVQHVDFSLDGTRVVTASGDSTARVWDAGTGGQLVVCEAHRGPVWHAAFSPDGTRLVTASFDGTARVWDAETGGQIAVCVGHGGLVRHADFSPDGMRLVTASDDDTARVWDAGTGGQIAVCEGHGGSVLHAAFSPDGTRLVTASLDGTARIWNARTGEQIATCEGHGGPVQHAAFNRNETHLVTAGLDRTARVWDAGTGEQIAACEGHGSMVLHAAFNPDGTRLVTASADGTARVWNAGTGEQTAACEGHDGPVLHAAFSPDGTRLVTTSVDGTARVWRQFRDTAELVDFVKPLLSRGLTGRQRRDSHLPSPANTPTDLDAIPPSPYRTVS
ncbi:hypothetical protein E2C05_17620 [Paracraurococcus ruber]|uniref:nSTAND1 domain-containing NTPase n=1 Tax=Paracraurococcus ruber TaxID=77675 RepID=UPI001057D4AF|nr:trypsin-like peptidase domain-containing protein [Paracraurococcus ruber]TDG29566.1 hypothetical protein E2C05_17620 [Paracraurococcus ruber]